MHAVFILENRDNISCYKKIPFLHYIKKKS